MEKIPKKQAGTVSPTVEVDSEIEIFLSVSSNHISSLYKYQAARSVDETKRMDTAELRGAFLVENIFLPNTITATYSMQDRYIISGAMPLQQKLKMPAFEELTKATYFLERREMGRF